MKDYSRYAIYYAPPPGPFADWAAGWLGWDAAAGAARPHPAVEGLPAPAVVLTGAPRKYGFHGTLKPPFRLAEGCTPDGLRRALRELAGKLAPVEMPGLRLARLGGFLALVHEGETGPLATLAAAAVTELDSFRAPPGEAELAQRRRAGLSRPQEALLARWGYPYVLEEFRFHLTLTGKLPEGDAAQAEAALVPHVTPLLPRPFRVESFCLFGEAEDGRFHLVERVPLGGT